MKYPYSERKDLCILYSRKRQKLGGYNCLQIINNYSLKTEYYRNEKD